MTKEDKELLLKDLSARLPYRPKVLLGGKEHCILCGIDGDKVYLNVDSDSFNIESIKPLLRPMSDMTEEERNEYLSVKMQETERVALAEVYRPEAISEIMDWLNAHHFDYRGLIEKGLAIAITKKMAIT